MNQEVIKYVIKDKIALALLAGLGFALLGSLAVAFFLIQPSDIQIPIRYSGYEDSLYNARWYERLSFIIFLILQSVMSVILAMIMHARGYKILAYFVIFLTIFIVFITTIVIWAVTKTVSL